MSFIRFEVREGLYRWREVIAGAVILALGLRFVLTSYGALFFIGIALALIGAAMVFTGIRRQRFPKGGGGAGVVEVDERQVTYFGPEGGGAVSIDDLARITIRTTADGPWAEDLFWDLVETGGTRLVIPGGAENSGALFDAFSALPGIDWNAVTKASASTEDAVFIIWERSVPRLH